MKLSNVIEVEEQVKLLVMEEERESRMKELEMEEQGERQETVMGLESNLERLLDKINTMKAEEKVTELQPDGQLANMM